MFKDILNVRFFIASGYWFHNILYIYFGFSSMIVFGKDGHGEMDVTKKRGGIFIVIHFFKLGFSLHFYPIKLKPKL